MRISDWSSDVCSSDLWFGELVQPDKLVHRGALGTYRGRLLNDGVSAETIAALTGESPRDLALYREALTHGSSGAGDYQRLEFLGGRVLGLVIASELFRRFPKAAAGEQIGRASCWESGGRYV